MGHSVREVIAKLMVTERGGWEDDAGGRGGAGLTDRADDNVTTGPQVTLLVTHSVSLGREFLCAANTGLPLIIKLVRPQCSRSSPWRRWTAATLTTCGGEYSNLIFFRAEIFNLEGFVQKYSYYGVFRKNIHIMVYCAKNIGQISLHVTQPSRLTI